MQVRRRLATARLLTLTGVGGVGKTRLALEAAAAVARSFPGGVWWVDLSSVRDPAAVAGATAAALGVPDRDARSLLDQLAAHLAGRRALLVLDNCEHVAEACADLAHTLLSAAPQLSMMATSRQTLGLVGEYILPVTPLPPEEAVELLRERAVALRPDFQVTDANRAAVARLCADLDGVPLAIELAASRLRTLTVDQAVERLEDRFALLTGGNGTARPHQRTLRATIDWSWELCDAAERLLWSRLSVFAGGFTLAAAEGACEGDGIARGQVLDLLDRLITQSIVLPTESEAQPRYRLLEAIREYGRERLAESGDEEKQLLRHRDFFLALAEHIDSHWFGPGQAEALARFRADHANLLAALDCGADIQTRLTLAATLRYHWYAGGFLGEGRRQFERALAAAPGPTPARARALSVAAWVALMQGDLELADRWLDEADTLGERLNDPSVRAAVTGFRGTAAQYRGRVTEAVSRFQEAVEAYTALGDGPAAAAWQLSLAQAQVYAGDPRASETGSRAIAAAEGYGEQWARAHVLVALGYNAWAHGELEAAEALTRTALACVRSFNDYVAVALMLEHLAWATASGGDHLRAGRLLGAAGALWQGIGTTLSAFDPQLADHHRRCEDRVVQAVGPAAYAKALAEGAGHDTPSRAVDFALSAGTATPAVPADLPSPLTHREREIAALVARGMSNKQVASSLGLSTRTVDTHVQSVLRKLGFGGRAQIAAWWTTQQAAE
ncbi:LuxR C-terminal-related transcriptional regulator [Kitasatospora viridis]|uniref:Putative ATPase n=1 Tax=Kitasatospora viridis TaxID=281105 RepID=A0A561TWH4_9ACTN|nr:LuxR C-terminal-related transcriptional regulator [Kitasatospora viridis]TWF91468.1 putative ATPase [Kitasatospora viridis]